MLAAGVGGQSERLAGHRRKMAVESRVTQEEIKKEPEKPIDREKVRGPDTVAAGRRAGPARGGRRGPRVAAPRQLSPSPVVPPADVPAAAARLHHQQRPPPPNGRVLPRERAIQRAADLHLVSGPRGGRAGGRRESPGPACGRRCRGWFWLSGATLGRSRSAGPFALQTVTAAWSGSHSSIVERR